MQLANLETLVSLNSAIRGPRTCLRVDAGCERPPAHVLNLCVCLEHVLLGGDLCPPAAGQLLLLAAEHIVYLARGPELPLLGHTFVVLQGLVVVFESAAEPLHKESRCER